MKQIYLLLAVVFFCSSAHAQLNKGQWIVGGNAAFSYLKDFGDNNLGSSTTKTTTVHATAGAGYFIIDKLCAGIRPVVAATVTTLHSYSHVVTSVSNEKSTSTAFGISPFIRYYFLPKTQKVNLLADVSYTYSSLKTQTNTSGTTVDPNSGLPQYYSGVLYGKSTFQALTFAGGVALFLNPKVSVELLTGYSSTKYINSTKNLLSVIAGFQIHLVK
jgi:hypothetical protein